MYVYQSKRRTILVRHNPEGGSIITIMKLGHRPYQIFDYDATPRDWVALQKRNHYTELPDSL